MQVSSSTSVSESVGPVTTEDTTWRIVAGAPILCWAIAFLLISELLAVGVAPLVIPQKIYLRLYLGPGSRNSTRAILTDPHTYLVWDATTGWRNRPGAVRQLWRIDDRGARVTSAARNGSARRVLFLGDSVTNGGMHVSNEETLSAYVEDAGTRSDNFATMLYGVDQMYLALTTQLRAERPQFIVIGVTDSAVQSLGNRYVPFRRRKEEYMPYLKPRFVLSDEGLKLVPLPGRDAYTDLLGDAKILRQLADTDDYYSAFQAYTRCGLTPLAGLLCGVRARAESAMHAVNGDMPYERLLHAILREIAHEGERRTARTLLLVHATAADLQPGRMRRMFPDRYAVRVEGLRQDGFAVVDGRAALRHTGLSPAVLFAPDGVHYSARGNRAIAEALRSELSLRADGRTGDALPSQAGQ